MMNKVKLIQKFLINSKNKFLIITNNDLHLNEIPNLNQKDIYKEAHVYTNGTNTKPTNS